MAVFYAVVGASRGIGLEYVRQLAGRADAVVFAVVRNKASSKHLTVTAAGLGNVHIVEGDVVDARSISRAAEEIASISGGKLDYLIHNAARMDISLFFRGYDDYANMEELDSDFIDAFKVNTLGVIHSIAAFLPLLRAGQAKKIIVISTGGADPGSITNFGIAGMVAYGTTKAAAVMASTKWAVQFKNEGFVVVSLTPGLVDTTGTIGDSGDPEGHDRLVKAADALREAGSTLQLETPAQSVAKQLQVIENLTSSDSGKLLSHDGGSFF
ncbi:NAD-P-binding protein [Pilatotrama ljubarskyi]|nr:NAD-P-binding protein [Pilatotrama ljubarskyi]